jgi:hypothetical protein
MNRTIRRHSRPTLEGLENRQLLSNCYLLNVASGKVLDDPGSSTDAGTLIQQYQLNGGLNQQWQPVHLADGNFEIVNASSGLVLDDPGGSTDNGTQIQQFPANGGLNQEWQFIPLSNGYFEILNAWSGKVLDIPNGSTDNGTVVQQFTANGGLNQSWVLLGAGSSAPSGPAYIANASSGKVLDLPNGSTDSGTILQQFELNGGSNQLWTLVPLDSGADLIVNMASGLVLDDPGGSTASGTLIQQYTLNGGLNQQWQPISDGDGHFQLDNVASGLVLGIPDGATADGTQIQQLSWNGVSVPLSQQWNLFGTGLFTLAPQPSGASVLTITGDQDGSGENDTIYVATSGGGVAATVNGDRLVFDPGAISSINVQPRLGTNTINIESTLPGVPVTISDANGSVNNINICSVSQFLDNIKGNVTIGGGGTNTLTVFDQNDPFNDTYTLTASTMTRTASAVITYGGLSAVTLDGGKGIETYNVNGTGTPLTLNAGIGNDTVWLGTGNLDTLPGHVTVNGQGGTDWVYLQDQGVSFNDTYAISSTTVTRPFFGGLTYGGVEFLTLTAENGNNIINVGATAYGTTTSINAGGGNDLIALGQNNLDYLRGPVVVDGQAGSDTVSVQDEGSPNSYVYTITGTTVTRPSFGGLTYKNAEALHVFGSYGQDTFNILGSLATTPSTLYAGAGNDVVNVGSATSSLDAIQGALNLNGQTGTDVLNFNDQAVSAGHVYILNGGSLTRSGAAAMTFDSFERVNLTASSHDDSLVLQSLPTGITMNLDMGAGLNLVYGPNTTNTWVINGYSSVAPYGEGRAVLNGVCTINGIVGLAGGTGPDRFEFMPGGFIPSVINGGGDGDTLDYSQWNAGVNVNLGAYGNGTYGYATAVGSSVNNIQNVIGSPYNDVLTGNVYGNVLVGGGGNDAITGGTGRSVLIGGMGGDTIHGRSGNDLIIGGYTSYDLNPTALDAIFAEWDSSDSFAQRVQYLSGPVGHLNGGFFLIPTGTNRTVFDDGAADTITDVAGNNWIISS